MEYIFKDLIEFLEQGYRRKHKEIKDWATIGGNLVQENLGKINFEDKVNPKLSESQGKRHIVIRYIA